ncbi:hypothetical protein ACLOJK_027586 [Asimina triloba]
MAAVKSGSRPPWVGFAAAVWMEIASGNAATFPLYSPAIKSVLGLNQQQLTILGVANDMGENIGLIPGIACNYFPPWVVLLIGTITCFVGYGLLWLAVSRIVSLPYWVKTESDDQLWIALCIGPNSAAWLGTGVIVTNMRNFPLSRGTVAGILKGYVGLSAAVFAEVYTGVLGKSASNLLLFLTLGIPAPTSSESLISGELNEEKTSLLNASSSNLGSFQEGDDVSDIDLLLAEGEGAVKKKRRPRRGEDFEFCEALVKADFWLLFLVYFIGVGSGVTVLNNLAQIGVAGGVNNTTMLLSLFSFCNFLGRLGGGVISEYFVRFNTIFLGNATVACTFYVATALLGICYGAQFSVMVPTASELFGLKSFGIIYNFMSLGNPLGALLFSGGLAGYIYDQEAKKQSGLMSGLVRGSSHCVGPNCFRFTFFVLAGVCVLGSVLSVVLTVRIRPVYRMLYSGGSFRLPQNSVH